MIDNPLVRKNAAIVALVMQHIEEHLQIMEVLKVDNPDLLDIALSNPIGTTRQMMGGGVATPVGQQQPAGEQEAQAMASQTAEAAMEQGAEPVAESALLRAQREQQQADQIVQGEPG
jgi:hypothetical protein